MVIKPPRIAFTDKSLCFCSHKPFRDIHSFEVPSALSSSSESSEYRRQFLTASSYFSQFLFFNATTQLNNYVAAVLKSTSTISYFSFRALLVKNNQHQRILHYGAIKWEGESECRIWNLVLLGLTSCKRFYTRTSKVLYLVGAHAWSCLRYMFSRDVGRRKLIEKLLMLN